MLNRDGFYYVSVSRYADRNARSFVILCDLTEVVHVCTSLIVAVLTIPFAYNS